MLGMRFISGKYEGLAFCLPASGEVTLGRAHDLEIVLLEEMVSRRHAKISIAGATLLLADLDSTNGTFVNGERITQANLTAQDRVLVGTSILKLVENPPQGAARDLAALKVLLEQRDKEPGAAVPAAGDLTDLPLPDLLQLLATSKRTGALVFTEPNKGKVYFDQGAVRFVVLGGLVGVAPMKALGRMLGWGAGKFRWNEGETMPADAQTLNGTTESTLIAALRQLAELRRLEPEMPDLDATAKIASPLTTRLAELNQYELDILQLVWNNGKLRQVFDKTEQTDDEAARNLIKLLRAGYLELT